MDFVKVLTIVNLNKWEKLGKSIMFCDQKNYWKFQDKKHSDMSSRFDSSVGKMMDKGDKIKYVSDSFKNTFRFEIISRKDALSDFTNLTE